MQSIRYRRTHHSIIRGYIVLDTQGKKVIPVQENMWTVQDGQVYLLGSKCEDCGEEFFPRREVQVCGHCGSTRLTDVKFLGEGTIVTYTSVISRPAGNFYLGPVPFNYIVVKLDSGAVRVQGHYIGVDEDDIHVGDRVKAVESVLWETDDEIVTTYKFVPAGKEG